MRLILCALLTAVGCNPSGGTEAESAASVARPEVRVAAVEQATLHDRLAVAGVLDPLPGKDVKVGALVAGRLVRVRVAEGDHVKQGQVLAELENNALADQVRRAEAEAHKARATADVAHSRERRDSELLAAGAASRQQAEESRAGAVAADTTIADAQANLSAARVQLERATLRAPIAGVVAAVFAHPGEPQDGSGKPVVEVVDPTWLELRAAVPAARATRLVPGDQVALRVEGGLAVTGAVYALAPLVDPATGAVTVRIRVDNRDGKVRGGASVRGEAVLGDYQGAAVLSRAILPGGDGGSAVLVVDGDVAHLKPVTVEVQDGDRVGVRGVAAGERVVTEGAYGLADGTRVNVVH